MKFRQDIRFRRCAAFTMVEIAICVAIIGFALVAIVGVLPFGMRTQRDNREETIINQDATYFLDAIRSGAQGADLLTNQIEFITVTSSNLVPNAPITFTLYSNSWTRPSPFPGGVGAIPLFQARELLGVLSTPRFEVLGSGTVRSNYVVAYVRSISGPAVDKGFNNNSRDFAFHYRLVPEIVPAGWTAMQNFNWSRTNQMTTNQIQQVIAQWNVLRTTAANLHEVRLLFRWPVLSGSERAVPTDPNSRLEPRIGGGRQTYRTLVGGRLDVQIAQRPYYFFQPNLYREVN